MQFLVLKTQNLVLNTKFIICTHIARLKLELYHLLAGDQLGGDLPKFIIFNANFIICKYKTHHF